MFRLVLSILLVVAFSGASAASVKHGLTHGSDHSGHHAQMAGDDPLADAEKAAAECCDTTGGMGSTSCFGDLVATAGISPIAPFAISEGGVTQARCDFSGLALGVPTGPPKA
ncbi:MULTISPECIES: hypothetical protein [unclassified Ruegeria]|uniref:hypothetical protein n=1 Tax=unclassified Ruegeria TaxID=2625375 RepID=UPI0014878A81|nr:MULTISPECIES: hypothetical protein [unclassified Ruegeria]NOD65603.1 hypothetical protein [Ruegeria sp. HKCCD6109]